MLFDLGPSVVPAFNVIRGLIKPHPFQICRSCWSGSVTHVLEFVDLRVGHMAASEANVEASIKGQSV